MYSGNEGVNVKPDPTVVYDILKIAQISKKDVLYVGDSGVDMQTAVNSGVTSVGVTWGFRDREELLANGAQYIADEPYEIMKWVRL